MKHLVKGMLFLAAAGAVYWLGFYTPPEQKHFAAVLARAQQGDVPAQIELGDLYRKGKGTPTDLAQALMWYRQSALAGDRQAQWYCAQMYQQGQGTEKDEEEAAVFLTLAAKQNHPQAQWELSQFYHQGLGSLAPHEGESLFWAVQAAAQGLPAAQERLLQAQQDQAELFARVKQFATDLQAAQGGEAQAMLAVGQAYQQGAPIERNEEEAVLWLSKAWQEHQIDQAGLALAQLYQTGDVVKDTQKANALWQQLADKSYPPAQYALGELAYQAQPPQYEDAYAWFSNAAAGGYAPGQYMTGFMLLQGQGTARSVPLAIRFFRSSAEQNYPAAQYVLGQMYWKGLGFPVNKKEGRYWLEKAAGQGNTAAEELLTGK